MLPPITAMLIKNTSSVDELLVVDRDRIVVRQRDGSRWWG
jgi:hypothetical protein